MVLVMILPLIFLLYFLEVCVVVVLACVVFRFGYDGDIERKIKLR